jgi:hypothetical protein
VIRLGYYVIDFEQITKKVDCNKFIDKIDELRIYLKMIDDNVDCDHSMLFRWIWFSLHGKYKKIVREDYSTEVMGAIEDRVMSLSQILTDILMEFSNKTGIDVYFEHDFDLAETFFILEDYDVVEYTPKAKRLMEEGIKFELNRDILRE